MLTASTKLPNARVMVDTIGEKTTVTLWDGTYTTTMRQGGEETDPETEYEYTVYQIEATPREKLLESIEADFETWYTAAKKAEREKMIKEAEKEMEQAVTANMAETLLDYDFRIMMLEELGGTM